MNRRDAEERDPVKGLTDGECDLAALRELIAQRRAQLHLNQIAAILLVNAAGQENSL